MHHENERVFYLDFIRVIAFLSIVLFHFNVCLIPVNDVYKSVGSILLKDVSIGHIGIGLFVIISGASLMLSSGTEFNAVSFYKKRFLSIFPTFFVSYFISVFFMILTKTPFNHGINPWSFILTLMSMDGMMFYRIKDYYLIGEWFVGMIIILYIFFPIIRKLVIDYPYTSQLSWLTFTIVLHIFYKDIFIIDEWRNPITQANLMIYGMIYTLYQNKSLLMTSMSILLSILIICGLFDLPFIFKCYVFSISFFSIFCTCFKSINVGNVIKNVISLISKYTFPAFLFHHIIINFFVSNNYLQNSETKKNYLTNYNFYIIICNSVYIN